ncbi:MAG: hypothetical protein ACHQF0_08490 [Chitinophagales bacterium]
MSELSLSLDQYDDIYSDFDSRQFLKRRISEDFLHELRIAKKYKKEKSTDLLLLLPQGRRDDHSEGVITNSLKDFFSDQFRDNRNKYTQKFNEGISLLIAGLLIMTVNSYINFRDYPSFFFSVVKIILEPGGWFLLWLGFDFLFYDLREIKKEREFFKELSVMNIHFRSS